jgi:co-chaperonin GroES (HSP10)
MSKTPPPDKLIVAVDLSQRNDYEITFGSLTLWMERDFGENGIDTNPVLAYVRGIGEKTNGFKVGDAILCHYNTFRSMIKNYRLGWHEEKDKDGLDLFTIDTERVRCILEKDGTPKPVAEHILVKRMEKEVDSTLIIPDTAKKKDMNWFTVERVNEADELEYGVGDTVLCYSYADVEIKYEVNRRQFSCFIVKTRDVNGFVKKGKSPSLKNLKLQA